MVFFASKTEVGKVMKIASKNLHTVLVIFSSVQNVVVPSDVHEFGRHYARLQKFEVEMQKSFVLHFCFVAFFF